MSKAIKAESGQGWARGAVAIGAALSVSGNVTHTVLTDSAVHLAIRIVQSAFLPVILFFAVEVFVRVAWRRNWLDYIGRAMLIAFPGFGAGYVSYFHLRDLAVLSGEDRIGSIAGPLAIDGLMIGGAVALLAIRAARLTAELKESDAISAVSIPATAGAVLGQNRSLAAPAVGRDAGAVLVHGGSGAAGAQSIAAPAELPQLTRKPRSSSEQLEKAVRMLIERVEPADVVTASGLSPATVRLYAKAVRVLRDNPQAEIGPKLDGRSVKADMINIIRDAMNRERAL